jgi:hypothetical protein
MATSINLGYCPWLAGATWNDQIGRLDVGGTTLNGDTVGGVLNTVNNPLQVLASSGMNITVDPGTAVIPSASGASNGAYRPTMAVSGTLTVATAPSSPNSRIDLVCIQVTDNGNGTSFSQVELVTGTAGNPPTAPSLPTNAVLLATITVGSGVSSITQGNIADNRQFTAMGGGVVVCPNLSSLPSGTAGTVGYDVVHDRFFELTASATAIPFKVMPFAPAMVIVPPSSFTNASLAGNTGAGGSFVTILSQNVTCDGQTDLFIVAAWAGVSQVTAVNGQVRMALFIDATQVSEIDFATVAGTAFNGVSLWGDNLIYYTNSSQGTTPSAGSHTVSWQGVTADQTSATTTTITGATGKPSFLRVQAVTL